MRILPGLSVACCLALGLLVAGCKPSSPEAFEPYARTRGYVDLTRPVCAAGYNAFLRHADAHPGEMAGPDGHEVVQPVEPGDPFSPTVWAKVKLYGVDGENRLYIFTTPGHPAHPAVILKDRIVAVHGPWWSINGCGWGDQQAYQAFEGTVRMLARDFEWQAKQSPPPDARMVAGHEDLTDVRAPMPLVVGKVADRAVGLLEVGRPATRINGLTPAGDLPPALNFVWLDPVKPGLDRYAMLEASRVDYASDEGASAMAAWCGGVEGRKTPKLCAQARKVTAMWNMIKVD